MDNSKMNLAIFLDLRKASDTLDHNILIRSPTLMRLQTEVESGLNLI